MWGDRLWQGGTTSGATDGPRGTVCGAMDGPGGPSVTAVHGPGGPSVTAVHGPGGPLLGGTIRSMTDLYRLEDLVVGLSGRGSRGGFQRRLIDKKKQRIS